MISRNMSSTNRMDITASLADTCFGAYAHCLCT